MSWLLVLAACGVCLLVGTIAGIHLGVEDATRSAAKGMHDSYVAGVDDGTEAALDAAARVVPDPYAGAILQVRDGITKRRLTRGAA